MGLSAANSKAANAKSLDLASQKFQQSISSSQQQTRFSQLLFDRARDEEEWRRKMGGGGGGGSRARGPYVPFSFLEMARKIEELRNFILTIFRNSINASTVTSQANPFSNITIPSPMPLLKSVLAPINNIFLNNLRLANDVLKKAKDLTFNFVNLSIAITSTFLNKILKLVLSKFEDVREEEDLSLEILFKLINKINGALRNALGKRA